MENKLILLVLTVLLISSCEKQEILTNDENIKTGSLLLNKSSTGQATVLLTYDKNFSEAKKKQKRSCFASSLDVIIASVTQSTMYPNQEVLIIYKSIPTTTGPIHTRDDPDEEEKPGIALLNISGEELTNAITTCHIQSVISLDFNI